MRYLLIVGLAVAWSCGSSSDTTFSTPSGSSVSGTGSGSGSGAGSGVGGGLSSSSASASGGATTSASASGSGTGGTGAGVPSLAPCAGKIYQCGNLIDDDNDGLIDAADPDCLGPCDNSEDGLNPNLPGAKGAPCKADCFWDNGNGSGNDDCYWDHQCDPLEIPPNFYPEGPGCPYDPKAKPGPGLSCTQAFTMQSQQCLGYCKPLTPKGCDCFGCCELPANGGKFVWLGKFDGNGNPTCFLDSIGDPSKCPPCTPVKGCQNTCGHCELCVGKNKLPADCYPSGSGGAGGASASSGSSGSGGNPQGCIDYQPCGLQGQLPCPSGFYCITGCCIELPPK